MASSLIATTPIGAAIPRRPAAVGLLGLRVSRPSSVSLLRCEISSAAGVGHMASAVPGDLLKGSTRTITTLFAASLVATKVFGQGLSSLAVEIREPLVTTVGPAFFAAIKSSGISSLNTPFTVVAAGMAKWLDIYSGVLMVRVLLSWFPNIPWERQPLSAIRDLCDPYLNLFRNVIPPIMDTLDVSPLFAFAVLGTLGSILKSTRGY